MRRPYVAFYGTLMSRFATQDELGVRAALRPLGPCTIRGVLPDVGEWPTLVPGDGVVHGELFEVLGEVFGLTVRARNVGSQIGAGLKSLVGGELKGMTKMLGEGRMHAQERLVEEAESRGANAVIAFRFDTSELGGTWTEICAYGTAVRATRL